MGGEFLQHDGKGIHLQLDTKQLFKLTQATPLLHLWVHHLFYFNKKFLYTQMQGTLKEKAAEFSGSSFHCYLCTVVVLLMPKI